MAEKYVEVVREMFEQRGYVAEDAPAHEFKHFVLAARTRTGRVCVLSNFEDKLAIGPMQESVAFMDANGFDHAVVIYTEAVTPHVRKLVDALQIGGIHDGRPLRIELFSRAELAYNVTRHVLVPRHELADAGETAQLHKYTGKLPLLLQTDPVARFLGFRRGDIVKVTRRDGLVAFRTVV